MNVFDSPTVSDPIRISPGLPNGIPEAIRIVGDLGHLLFSLSVVIVKRPIGDAKISIAQMLERWKWTWWRQTICKQENCLRKLGSFV